MARTPKAPARSKLPEPERSEEAVVAPSGTYADVAPALGALLEHDDPARRAAAAIVAGELELGDEALLDGLRKALRRMDDAELRRRAAEAIGRIGPRTLIRDLEGLLKDPDELVRDAAKHVLATGRSISTEELATLLEAKDERQRASAVAVLGARGTLEARRKIIAQIPSAGARLADAIRDAARPMFEGLSGDDAHAAAEELVALISADALTKVEVAGVLVDLLALVDDERAAEGLADVAGSRARVDVRARALDAMRRAFARKKPTLKSYRFLVELVESKGTPVELFGPASDTLTGLDVPLELEPRVRALASSPHTPVRRWVLRALGSLDTAPAAKTLAKVVEDGDANDREIALEAAVGTTNGRLALAKLLAGMSDAEKARPVAAALKRRASEVPPSSIHQLQEAAIDAHPDVSPLIIDLLRAIDGDGAARVHDSLFEKAVRLKNRGQYGDALELFKRIWQAKGTDSEARFQQGVCELKLSRKIISRASKSDPCLHTLGGLTNARDFQLVDRLKSEPGLGAEDLYYLGFSLAEGSDPEQGLAGDVLTVIMESADDAKLRQMAKNKLSTMGWID